jgi:ABC-2 type transport system permease protein
VQSRKRNSFTSLTIAESLGLFLFLPPVFTLLLGHAFEVGALSNVPATLLDRDQSSESKAFVERLRGNRAFAWKPWSEGVENAVAKRNLAAAVIIPKNWGAGLHNGDPQPVELFADGADTNTAPEIEGNLQAALAKFQMDNRETLIDNLPDEVFDFGRKLSPEVRHEFVSTMTPWEVKTTTLYSPDLKFIHFAMPGIVSLILQLMTVTFTAAGLAKEKESGSFARLQVAPINKFEIVAGKILPYLVIASIIGTMLFILGAVHFHVGCGQPSQLALAGLLFLLSSAGLGVLTASISQTQTQAIQISVLFLLPVFLLAGAFAPLNQLPVGVRLFSYLFPLTYFCDACRQINLYGSDFLSVLPDIVMLTIGGAVTCCLAAWRLTVAIY